MACDVTHDTGETGNGMLLRTIADKVVASRRGFGLFSHFAYALSIKNGIRIKRNGWCDGTYMMNVPWIVK